MATSISPVATIWLSAPSISHGQNAGAGHGTWSPVATSTAAKNTIENGKPNRKRILVAPQRSRDGEGNPERGDGEHAGISLAGAGIEKPPCRARRARSTGAAS